MSDQFLIFDPVSAKMLAGGTGHLMDSWDSEALAPLDMVDSQVAHQVETEIAKVKRLGLDIAPVSSPDGLLVCGDPSEISQLAEETSSINNMHNYTNSAEEKKSILTVK